MTAFTAPGRTIYLSRALLEALPTDDAVALVVAHELAHHRLGHVPRLTRGWAALPAVARRLLRELIDTRAHERDADLLAVELCVAAGYDPEVCLVALDIMEHESLDWGDVDGVVDDDRTRRLRRSHPSLRRRGSDLRGHVAAMARGHRLADELRGRRAARQRRAVAVAGMVAAAVAVAVVTRRPPTRWW